ncbi:inner centromere protein-like isoform X2 [Ruditapes philippinarum]|uniref:inner centromere protein-like isoform X2 n=1 Tax=Ruditapes philippinarum TaxID=129788 RepID=UPI00295B2AD0|nr:inner centromere protein-like isoform X2 [Ruditapes philippinarum]
MSTKDNYKKLQDSIQQFDEQNKAVIQSIQKIDSTKKEKDAKANLETLEGQLQSALQNVKQLEKEIQEAQTEVNQKLGRKSSGPAGPRKPLDPDDQEMAYELKSQLLKNVEIQNQKLKTEFTLHEKMTESRLLSQQNKRLHDDVTLSRANSMRLIKVFERKAKEADTKLKEMTIELHRSQDLAEKYRNLYELERRKNLKDGEHLPPVEDTTKLPDKESSYTFLGGGIRINDIIRKNEVLTEENTDLKREIRRLKEDNNRLVRQTKLAMQDRDQILHKLETSEANRRNLLKRLEKEKDQHQTLSRSLTRQASDWILLKKQIAQFDEEYRWSQVIGLWLKNARGRRQTFPPLAPEALQEMVANDPAIHESISDLDETRTSNK